MQELLKSVGDDSVYMFNPPLVHSLDLNQEGNKMACALGMFDVDSTSFLQSFMNFHSSSQS